MALDTLYSYQYEIHRDAGSLCSSTYGSLHSMFARMQDDHMYLQKELLSLILRRGWHHVPAATHQVIHQVAPIPM